MSKYLYTDDMAELSGFGGSYEAGCRAMVVAGLEWLDAHPDAKPQFHGCKNIFGIIQSDNADAKALSDTMLDAPIEVDGEKTTVGDYGATGAMHQQAISHVLWISRNGWDKYVAESRERRSKKAKHGHQA